MVSHPRHQGSRVLTQDHRYRRDASTCREPVSPANDEAGIFSERVMHQWVQPAGARTHRRQLRHRQCTQQCVDRTRDPYRHEERHRREPGRDLTRRAQDAHTDRVAHQDRQTECDSQHLQQASGRRLPIARDLVYQRVDREPADVGRVEHPMKSVSRKWKAGMLITAGV